MKILEDYPLKDKNTFGIDVKAEWFFEFNSENELKEILSLDQFKSVPKLILGGGSNILFTKDFPGIVLKNSIPGIKIIKENGEFVLIEAGSGVIWHELVLYCVNRNFGGIENLSLIPGTVGAAPIQNIGAYGQELKDVFESLGGVFIDDRRYQTFTSEECRFGYRDSIFKNELKDKFIITKVILRLNKKPVLNLQYGAVKGELDKMNLKEITIKDVSDVICRIRRSKLPDPSEIGNAGSFFKNPEIPESKFESLKKELPEIIGYKIGNGKVKLAAGWLIEQCGWKGKRVGNTGAHAKQALVLVNYGNAGGNEILSFAERIKESVFRKFGINLKEEVNVI
ncbi:MAG TPA: UDP-N-acetylmuramate dehydrogenase [Ignavibacteriaceae bacterium]|nr:UDP-N-acetylmuramate dehydrogenase [Ignavibacteriaceae bacterium]